MIVCLCQNVSEKTLEALIEQGKTLKDIQSEHHVGMNCGACAQDVKKICSNKKSPTCQTTPNQSN